MTPKANGRMMSTDELRTRLHAKKMSKIGKSNTKTTKKKLPFVLVALVDQGRKKAVVLLG